MVSLREWFIAKQFRSRSIDTPLGKARSAYRRRRRRRRRREGIKSTVGVHHISWGRFVFPIHVVGLIVDVVLLFYVRFCKLLLASRCVHYILRRRVVFSIHVVGLMLICSYTCARIIYGYVFLGSN
jgi:hypothetical protein